MTDIQAKRLTMAALRLLGLAQSISHLVIDLQMEAKYGHSPSRTDILKRDLESSRWALETLRTTYEEKREGVLSGRYT